MNTKLTLRMDENLIAQAMAYAAKEGRSVSDLVGTYFARLAESKTPAQLRARAYPLTDALFGALAGSKLDESDYKKYLEEKHK